MPNLCHILPASLLFVACTPTLDLGDGCDEEPEQVTSPLVVQAEPDASLDAVSPWGRFHVAGTPAPEPSTMVVAEGSIGPGHLSRLAEGQPSDALRERLVPSISYRDPSGRRWLQPTRALVPGVEHAVAVGSLRQSIAIISIEDTSMLELRFPPEGRGAGATFGVWCGSSPRGPWPSGVELAPDLQPAPLFAGVAGVGERCITLAAEAPLELVAPVPADDLRLEPVALRSDATRVPAEPVVCEANEIPVGPGCLEVHDDRARLRGPSEPLLWVVEAPLVEVVTVLDGTSAWIHPLTPSSTIDLAVAWQAVDGEVGRADLTIQTAAPMPHLVITEVLANPVGPEPQQEWVEVTNDGLAPAWLGGWTLRDVGSPTPLPSRAVPPGATVVLVRDDHDVTLDYDPSIPEEARVPVGPELGTNGLSNAGEPIDLIAPTGRRVSRFPASPKPKAGLSVARRSPRTADDDPEGFLRSDPSPGSLPEP